MTDPLCVTPPAVAANRTRILTIGDSITRAAAGDYTWRYFLWKHLVTAGGAIPRPTTTAFDLVGPYVTLVDPVDNTDGNTDFRCDFAEATGAEPGAFLAQYLDKPLLSTSTRVRDMVRKPQPGSSAPADVLVVFAGINDLVRPRTTGSPVLSASEVLGLMSDTVDQARAANPAVKIVLVTAPRAAAVPKPGSAAARIKEFDDLLVAQAPGWSQGGSPVAVADAAQGWSTPELTYDGIHPNPQGEVSIATSVANALYSLGVGPAAAPLPNPPLAVGPAAPAVLDAPVVDSGGVALSWALPPGSIQTRVERKDISVAGGDWTGIATPLLTADAAGPPYRSSYVDQGFLPTHVYQYRLVSAKGTTTTNALFQLVQYSTTVTSRAVSTPGPGVPTGVSATAGVHAVTLGWAPVSSVTSYQVRSRLSGGAWVVTDVGASTTSKVTGLTAGRGYGFAVRALRGTVPGPWSSELTRTPRAGRIGTPTKPVLTARTDHRIAITWAACTGATRYRLQVRKVGGRWSDLGFTTKRSLLTGVLKRGTAYEVRLQPWDGYVAGAFSGVVRRTAR